MKTPTYNLEEIKELLQDENTRHISLDDMKEAVSLGYADDEDMVARVLKLRPKEFHKTMPALKLQNVWQDVYYTYDGRTKLYIKLQKSFNGKGVIVSFKRSL